MRASNILCSCSASSFSTSSVGKKKKKKVFQNPSSATATSSSPSPTRKKDTEKKKKKKKKSNEEEGVAFFHRSAALGTMTTTTSTQFPEFASAREDVERQKNVLRAHRGEKIETIEHQQSNPSLSELSMDVFRAATDNPEAAAVIALASLIIIPKAIEQIGKKIVLPLGAILVAYSVLSHPESAGTFVAGAAGWAFEHPMAIAFVAVGLLALQLSPYIIIALLLALIFNISNVVPDELNPLLPKDVKENIREVKKDAQIAREALAPVERSFSELESFKNEVQIQKERARKNRLAREERERREEKEAREKPIKIAELKKKAAEEEKEKKRKQSQKASASVEDITRCMSLPTPEQRVKCVDRNHEKY
jgi:hypothetical protein